MLADFPPTLRSCCFRRAFRSSWSSECRSASAGSTRARPPAAVVACTCAACSNKFFRARPPAARAPTPAARRPRRAAARPHRRRPVRASSSPLSLRAREPVCGGGRAKAPGQLRAGQFPRLRGSHFLDLAPLLHRLLHARRALDRGRVLDGAAERAEVSQRDHPGRRRGHRRAAAATAARSIPRQEHRRLGSHELPNSTRATIPSRGTPLLAAQAKACAGGRQRATGGPAARDTPGHDGIGRGGSPPRLRLQLAAARRRRRRRGHSGHGRPWHW